MSWKYQADGHSFLNFYKLVKIILQYKPVCEGALVLRLNLCSTVLVYLQKAKFNNTEGGKKKTQVDLTDF